MLLNRIDIFLKEKNSLSTGIVGQMDVSVTLVLWPDFVNVSEVVGN